jgi:Aspartyl protease
MPTYDSNVFDPPAPLARVSLRTLHDGNSVTDVPMLIDSGSDLTLIRERFVDELRVDLDPNESFELAGFDGHTIMAKSVRLDLLFLGRTFRGRFALVNSQSGILGRKSLNHFAVLLDGPRLSWQQQMNSTK